MMYVCSKIIEKKKVRWVYGCGLNLLNKFKLDIEKQPGITKVTKEALYFFNYVKNVGLIWKIFENFYEEKFEIIYSMALYS